MGFTVYVLSSHYLPTVRDGSIDVHEFAALWKYIQEWKDCFDRWASISFAHSSCWFCVELTPSTIWSRFDTNKSGNIDALELHQALSSFGYSL